MKDIEVRHLVSHEIPVEHIKEITGNFWISVKDALPEHESFVLCCTVGYVPRVSLFHCSNLDYLFLSPDCMRVQFSGITHWMPIPGHPKGC